MSATRKMVSANVAKDRIIAKFPQVTIWQNIELLPSFLRYGKRYDNCKISSGMAKDRIIAKFPQVWQKIELLPSFFKFDKR